MGSPSFMAPEAWRGLSDLVDQRADVYSLGVILFRVLAGDLPFGGDTLKEKFLTTTTSDRPSLRKRRPDLPREVDEWVALALALDRDERFGNVRALWSAFLRAVDVAPPRRGPRPSIWAAAKGAVKKLSSSSKPPSTAEATSNDPSFTREALARSAFRVSTPTSPVVDAPPATRESKRLPVPPPAGRAKAPRPDATIELRDEDFELPKSPKKPPPRRVEKTVSVSDADLLAGGDTLPETSAPVAPPPPPRKRERKP
jgi:serine/threonine protein kinase